MLKSRSACKSFTTTTTTIHRFLHNNNTSTIMSLLTKGLDNLFPPSPKGDPFYNFPITKTNFYNNSNVVYVDIKSLNNNHHHHHSRFSDVGLRLNRPFALRNQPSEGGGAAGSCGGNGVRLVNNVGLINGYGGKLIGSGDSCSLSEKVMVAVDVDEVLGNFVSALNRFIADRYSSNHSVSEYHVYEFFKIWNCSRDEADIRVHEFFKTPYFKTGIYPLPGAQKALHKLSELCKLSVVTSRQNIIKDHTVEWIEKHYPGIFEEIHFGNHFALHGESRPKSEICRSLGAKVLVDDNPKYAIECAEVGIRVLLFDYENSYPWCKIDSVHEHPLVTKVHNWEQVEEHLVSWIAS